MHSRWSSNDEVRDACTGPLYSSEETEEDAVSDGHILMFSATSASASGREIALMSASNETEYGTVLPRLPSRDLAANSVFLHGNPAPVFTVLLNSEAFHIDASTPWKSWVSVNTT